jgi:hypothetical protein
MAKNTKPVGRVPLMAGNWKMNLDHLQATHLVQKLDWTLRDAKHDHAAVEVAVLPPFTVSRSFVAGSTALSTRSARESPRIQNASPSRGYALSSRK